MSDTSHHDAHVTDEGFHEIQLSGKELVFLFMATTLVAVVIFLCGVQVGRNVRTDRVDDGSGTLASAAAPAASVIPSQPQASAGPPSSEPPAPAAEPDDELSYAKRLQSDSTPAEKLKKPSTPAPVAAAKPPSAPPASKSASGGRPGDWIVQLTALQDRAAASAIAQRLVAKGYPAFVLDPPAGSPALFRVQVGGYADRPGAEQAARRLEKEEQFKTYVRSR